MVKGFKKCENGHYFSENLNMCPYCSAKDDAGDPFVTRPVFDEADDALDMDPPKARKRKGFNQTAETESDLNKTIPAFDLPDTEEFEMTHIIPGDDERSETDEDRPRDVRKLVGWLVSYSIDYYGIDFKLHEGRNAIGRNAENKIVINDSSVSGHHATLLFRHNNFWIKDELSANGSFLNGKEINPNKIEQLKDGDVLKFGKAMMIFKTPLPTESTD